MRISDWSSDVCSSDLSEQAGEEQQHHADGDPPRDQEAHHLAVGLAHAVEAVVEGVGEEAPGSGQREARVRTAVRLEQDQIGRATSELQSLMRISYAVFCLKKKKHTNRENTHEHTTKYKAE